MLRSEQARTLLDAWTQGTQKAWEGWLGAFSPPASKPPPVLPWSEAAVESVRAWVDQTVPVANSVLGRVMPDPEALTSLFRASVDIWEAFGREAGAPGPQGAFGATADRILRHPFGLPEPGTVARDLGELWGLYAESIEELCGAWLRTSKGAADPLESSTYHETGLVRFSDLSWDALERTYGRLLQSPSIGFTRELNEKLLGAFSAWLEFRRASFDYQMALSAGLIESTTRFLRELAARAGRGEPVGGLRDFLRLWGDTLDEVLVESFRSDEYAKIQGRLVRAAMAYRIRERDAVDVVLKIGHVPTRRDVDEVARGLYDLRKEVRGIARSVPEPANGHPAAGPGPSEPKPETKPAATRPAETKLAETKLAETKPAETKPAETGKRTAAPSGESGRKAPASKEPGGKPGGNRRPPAGSGKAAS